LRSARLPCQAEPDERLQPHQIQPLLEGIEAIGIEAIGTEAAGADGTEGAKSEAWQDQCDAVEQP